MTICCCFHYALVPNFFVREVLNILLVLKKNDANQRAIFTSLFETNFQSLRGLLYRHIFHIFSGNKQLVLLNSKTPSSCINFYTHRERQIVSILGYQRNYSIASYSSIRIVMYHSDSFNFVRDLGVLFIYARNLCHQF